MSRGEECLSLLQLFDEICFPSSPICFWTAKISYVLIVNYNKLQSLMLTFYEIASKENRSGFVRGSSTIYRPWRVEQRPPEEAIPKLMQAARSVKPPTENTS